ncbi:MAG: Gfo/Idh/MocA family oxidoreductase [Burkholderiales bacterium]|jgi:predicted dehydrogenase|nr:Gfo/Idh/MocA family oxidoreductase [Burkholderiales bacterium]
MRRPLRIAAVGAGYFSQFQYLGWRNMAREGLVELVGLANRDRAKGQAVAARFGVPQVFGTVAELLDATRPDLLDIITSPPTHREFVRAAVERGVAAICQKPFGTDYGDALAITGLAEAAGVPLIVHENFRWQPWYREAKRLIVRGELGSLHAVSFRLRPGDGQGASAYLDRQPYFQTMPRLLVVETGIHWVDTFRYLIGEVRAVTARLRRINPAIAGEDAGIVILEFAGGATGLLDGNRCNDHVATNPRRTMGECWLEGSRGVLRLDGDARLHFKPHHGDEREHAYDRGPDDTFGGGACEWLQRHVVDHFLHDAPLENTAREYLGNLVVQEAVYCSHADGRRIELDRFDPLRQPVTATFESPMPAAAGDH